MERTVESWKALVSGWLALAGFQLYHWWLEAADERGRCWRFGAAVRVPFGEGDEAMLRFALEGHDDAPRFRSQRTCFLFYHQDRGTQLGAPVTDRGTAWNPFWRPDVACEPQRSIRPHDLTRPYPNMGVTEF